MALQDFAVFCQTSASISHKYTYFPPFWTSLPSPLPFHPSMLIQSPCQAHFLELIDLPTPAWLWLWPVGPPILVVACGVFSCDMRTLSCSTWDLVPWAGFSPSPLHWELGVLTTGPPGRSLKLVFDTFGLCQALLCSVSLSPFAAEVKPRQFQNAQDSPLARSHMDRRCLLSSPSSSARLCPVEYIFSSG